MGLALLKVFLCVPKNLPAQFKFVCQKTIILNVWYVI